MKCRICDKEVREFREITEIEHSNNHEDRLLSQMIYCKDCFMSEYDCKAFGYKTKKEALLSWELNKEIDKTIKAR
jgi:hypothetical protein